MPLVLSGTNGISTNGTNWALTPDSAGRSFRPNQPHCQLGVSNAYSTTGTLIPWDYVHVNTGGHYNTSTRLFTCPVAGRYLVTFFVMSNANATTMDISVSINGNETDNRMVPYSGDTGGNYNHVGGTSVYSLAANDTIGTRLNSGTVYGGGNGRHSTFAIYFLG